MSHLVCGSSLGLDIPGISQAAGIGNIVFNAYAQFATGNILVDRLRHLVPAMSLSADSNGGQAATI